MSALELKNLSKKFPGVVALDDIELSVEAGDFCVLLGPSGCGKSTALRCIAGLEPVTAGDILIDGKRVNDLSPRERGIAMVFQSYALYPHMTVRENLAFPLEMGKMEKDDIRNRVEDTARMLRIDNLLDRPPRELSGGQRQRVAIGRALVREPTLFLFDEPLSNLDAKLRNEMRLEIASLHRRLETTVIYVTHDQVEAMTLGRTIVVMNDGHIEQIGSPDDVYQRPTTRFVAGFVGTPAMNFASGKIQDGRFDGDGIRISVDTKHAGPVDLGVRPEDVTLEGDHGQGNVELIENLGSDRYAHVRFAEDRPTWAIRIPADKEITVGDSVSVSIEAGKVHLFADGRRVDQRP